MKVLVFVFKITIPRKTDIIKAYTVIEKAQRLMQQLSELEHALIVKGELATIERY